MKYGWIFSGIIPSNPLVHRKDPLKAPLTLLAATWRNNLQLFRSGRIHASFCHNDGIGKHIPDRCHEFCETLPPFEFHLYGFQSSAAECPSLEESISAADDNLLER